MKRQITKKGPQTRTERRENSKIFKTKERNGMESKSFSSSALAPSCNVIIVKGT